MALPLIVAGILGGCDPVRVLASERTRLAREQMRAEGLMIDWLGRVCCSCMKDIWQKDEIDSLVTGRVAAFVEACGAKILVGSMRCL